MRQTLKRLFKLTAGYSLVTLLGPVVTILLVPLYTRVLAPADYGVVAVAQTFGPLVGIFINLGVDQALNAFFFDGDLDHQRNLVTTAAHFGRPGTGDRCGNRRPGGKMVMAEAEAKAIYGWQISLMLRRLTKLT